MKNPFQSIRLRFAVSLAFVTFMASSIAFGDEPIKADVVIYGGTPAGITAAIAAAKEGRSVALIELNNHVGGMVSGGLTNTDIGLRWTVGGLCNEFLNRAVNYYKDKYGADSEEYKACKNGRKYEPSVAEKIFEEMLKEQPGIKVWKRHRYHSTLLENGRIASFVAEDPVTRETKTFSGEVFIDASYTGDLMAGALVPHRIGRESRAEYGETLAGISKGPEDVIGSGDHRTQAYNYRVSITSRTGNRVLFPKPAQYDPEPWRTKFEAAILNGKIKKFGDLYISKAGANDKRDSNWCDLVEGNEGYAQGDWETRARIEANHRDYYLSMLYYLQNDPALPESFREDARTWGLPKDEFTDKGNFPFQLYIRESRRMIGRYVLKEQDLTENRLKPDGICAGNYGIDCHGVQYVVINGKKSIERTKHRPVDPYDIPYACLTPEEPGNLLVPVCISSTHVAYCSLRMEPVYMMLGEAAGKAAHLAITGKTTVQEVDVTKLREMLIKNGAVLDAAVPGRAPASKEPKEESEEEVAAPEVESSLPKVLIIGDSISIGYTPIVRERLKEKADVQRIPGNGSSTSHGLSNLSKWLGSTKWDVIHFNFGLHDAKLPPEGARHSEPEVYEKNLRELVSQLKATGAKLVWATTTPIPDDGNLSETRKFGNVDRYNEIAAKVMKENGIAIDDLNAAMKPHAAKYLRPKDVHFNKEGSALLGEAAAKSIEAQLPKP